MKTLALLFIIIITAGCIDSNPAVIGYSYTMFGSGNEQYFESMSDCEAVAGSRHDDGTPMFFNYNCHPTDGMKVTEYFGETQYDFSGMDMAETITYTNGVKKDDFRG